MLRIEVWTLGKYSIGVDVIFENGGTGVWAEGRGIGVFGRSYSTDGTGVIGEAASNSKSANTTLLIPEGT